ncbi:dioxygenase [Rhodococcus sp. BE178]|uniref:dioxygenase family protein n=1 Tax=Rhodococcus sp. BE178 TaxID=2817737 RepID=UPI003D1B9D16
MILTSYRDVTPSVLEVMAETKDPRFREIITSLVTHLHQFVKEVRLTEAEFRTATKILNEIGQATDDKHNEAVLMCGSLGISTLVYLMNNGDNGQTETQHSSLGPFWRLHSPRTENGGTIVRSETPGAALFVNAHVIDKKTRQPVVGAEIDVWHSSPVGLYENQDPDQVDFNLRGKFTTDEEGRFWLRSVRMSGYPIPTNTVVGRLLEAQGRHPCRPAHLHALINAEGYKVLTAQVYPSDDSYLETDVQFGVTRALIGNVVEHREPHPDHPELQTPWYSLDYTFELEEGPTELPLAPIK